MRKASIINRVKKVCLNGREWLRRIFEQEEIERLAKGRKFLHIGDYRRRKRTGRYKNCCV